MEIWILTFNRPKALSRLLNKLAEQGHKASVFSNHPEVRTTPSSALNIDRCIVNTLNSPGSNSWCARSWNSIFMKAFERSDELICIQDDTDINPGFVDWVNREKQTYDFISGPAGDQFFYIHLNVLRTVGWWDERYIGCYAGDADYFKRVFMEYDLARISIQESHNWGLNHNLCGLSNYINTEMNVKAIDPNYSNQHWQMEEICNCTTNDNPVIKAAQRHFREKWGIDLDNGQPMIGDLNRKMSEIDWYPAFTRKFGITFYDKQEREFDANHHRA